MEMPPLFFAFGIYVTGVCVKIQQMSVENKALTRGPRPGSPYPAMTPGALVRRAPAEAENES